MGGLDTNIDLTIQNESSELVSGKAVRLSLLLKSQSLRNLFHSHSCLIAAWFWVSLKAWVILLLPVSKSQVEKLHLGGGGGGSFFPSNEIIAAIISLKSLHTSAPCTTYHTKFNIQLRVLLRGALNSLPFLLGEPICRVDKGECFPSVLYLLPPSPSPLVTTGLENF